jgi:hypothetical protein
MNLLYQNQICHLASMHKKEKAIKEPFKKFLGCEVIPVDLNTDLFGTFTGEIERKLTPHKTAKEKCYKGLEIQGGTLGISSEGSFNPHPYFPFITANLEILFFTDLNLGFELTLTKLSTETNYSSQLIQSTQELFNFANKALFPSHALILRPEKANDPNLIFKGIQNPQELENIFYICMQNSKEASVFVETDMRAHMNPTRMKIIEELSYEMADRLKKRCPSCQIPGWGIVEKVSGLPCKACYLPTDLIKSESYGCCSCSYREEKELDRELADPSLCPSCNP